MCALLALARWARRGNGPADQADPTRTDLSRRPGGPAPPRRYGVQMKEESIRPAECPGRKEPFVQFLPG